MTDGNGAPVTWRELHLVVDPIKDDVKEIRDDVKLLLDRQASAAGAVVALRSVTDTRRFWTTLAVALIAALLTAGVSGLLYIAFS